MNRDLWLKLGVGLDPQKILNMQSANSQSNATAGVISELQNWNRRVRLEIPRSRSARRSVSICLLGRPFFRFTSCTTTDNTDGSQEITLTCPNTGKRVTIPTRRKTNKNRNPFRQDVRADVGFQNGGQRQ
jgi:hypothetical protein